MSFEAVKFDYGNVEELKDLARSCKEIVEFWEELKRKCDGLRFLAEFNPVFLLSMTAQLILVILSLIPLTLRSSEIAETGMVYLYLWHCGDS